MKIRIQSLSLVFICSSLFSCEGFMHMHGQVIDIETKKPIENAQILLVLKGRDTLRNIKYDYDTLSRKERISLRKKGVKDDYSIPALDGFSRKPTICKTDTNGLFSVGTILVPCVPKCPTCKLIFIKDGYKQFSLKLYSIVNDSINVSLEKIPVNAALSP